jgi:AraC-like DNA-binding protein
MPREPHSLASLSGALWEALDRHYGVDPAQVFEDAGICKKTLEDRAGRVPISTIRRLWEVAIAVTGDAHIALNVGRTIRPATLHALGFAWLASATLAEALQRQVRYFDVLTTFFDLDLEPGPEQTLLTVSPIPGVPLLPTSADMAFSTTLALCRLSSTPTFVPVQVQFRKRVDDPPNRARYQSYYRCPLVFGAARDALYFSNVSLREPLPSGNADLARENEKLLDRYLRELESGDTASAVRRQLVNMLPSGQATEEQVARSLNRSVSSLQRYLRAEGTRYREILDRTREELAREYLQSGDHPIAEVAYLLGYSDQSTFTRAFKRWTGLSPGAFLQQTAEQAPAV